MVIKSHYTTWNEQTPTQNEQTPHPQNNLISYNIVGMRSFKCKCNISHKFGSISMEIDGHLFNDHVIISIVNMENLSYISGKNFIMMCREFNIRCYSLRQGTHS